MQITHEEARTLIQLNADESLNPQEKNTLAAHLEECSECRAYAEEIQEIEDLLVPLMNRQWSVRSVPLSIDALTTKRTPTILTNTILTTRSAVISLLFLAFLFTAWQFALSGGQTATPLPVGILPVPTPSTQSTSTKISLQNCIETSYVVQRSDTLQSIAYRFATSKEEIMIINGLKTETLETGAKLTISICNFTPTGIMNPTRLSVTYTPSISPIASTSGG